MSKKQTLVTTILSMTLVFSMLQPVLAQGNEAVPSVTEVTYGKEAVPANLEHDLSIFAKDLAGIPLDGDSYNGGIAPIGDQAFAVSADGKSTSLMVAGRYGAGRVTAIGGEVFFNFKDADAPSSNARVARNTLLWLTEDLPMSYEKALAGEGTVSILTKSADFGARSDLPIQVKKLANWSDKDTDGKPLLDPEKYPVAHIDYAYVTKEDVPLLLDYVHKGGRLAVALKGWVLEQFPYVSNDNGKDHAFLSSDYPLQELLNKLGISLMNNQATKWDGTAPILTPQESNHYNLNHILVEAKAVEAGTKDIKDTAIGLTNSSSQDKLTILTSTLVASLGSLSPEAPLYAQVIADSEKLAGATLPFNATSKPYSAALLPLLLERILKDPNGAKSPFADAFPGSVPAGTSKVDNKQVNVDFEFSKFSSLRQLYTPDNWISTGLYANPGESITIDVPDGVTDLDVQIGAHTDNLSSLGMDKWLRAPVVTKKVSLTPGENTVTSPYGGLIYLIPTKPTAGKKATISVSGGYHVPYYVLGETSNNEWKKTIRNYDAPWAELQSERVILTVPSEYIRNLDNPDEVLKLWDEMFKEFDDLAGLTPDQAEPHKSVNLPFRYVGDHQISAGFMHAGYPIMFFSKSSAKDAVTVEGIKTLGGWGWWHETGHEYQQSPWTWGAITEATVNLFSLRAQDYFHNSSRLLLTRTDGTTVYDQALKYVNKPNEGKDFNSDQIDVWSRLVMFRQLQLAYGWELYTKIFTSVREIPAAELPKNDSQELDLFVVKASEMSGHNLLEFFDKWGLKYSAAAKSKVTAMNLPKPDQELWTLKETSLVTGPETTRAYQHEIVKIPFQLHGDVTSLTVQVDQSPVKQAIKDQVITLDPTALSLAPGEHRVFLTAADKQGNKETATFTLTIRLDLANLDEVVNKGAAEKQIKDQATANQLLILIQQVQAANTAEAKQAAWKALEDEIHAKTPSRIHKDYSALLLKDIAYLKG
ncbi:M60 family metallopeptidase [Paenibacillus sp. 1001270B_150601_E10]|uniref:M60 family metallopeptidase n=1 Tax=Paenibacillus sp. 1001270B_150601_E10 TaxID=2787079 RepID=UPI00189F36B6|nr:M60 family metallopeptidase [Paenibacillus sp. 1001270B_150601_E10]